MENKKVRVLLAEDDKNLDGLNYISSKPVGEVNKMAESQSRYGIMEELNKSKIAEKEALANLERETDNTIYETEKQLSNS